MDEEVLITRIIRALDRLLPIKTIRNRNTRTRRLNNKSSIIRLNVIVRSTVNFTLVSIRVQAESLLARCFKGVRYNTTPTQKPSDTGENREVQDGTAIRETG